MSDRPTPETDENASPHIGFYSCATVTSNFARKLERERDEAREELHDIRLNLGEDADGFTLLHAVCALQNERDEAREYSKATWQSLRASQDEVLRLTFENRELRNLSNE